MKARKCPKCGKVPIRLTELWKDHFIQFDVDELGFIDPTGNLEPGRSYKVEAECECGYKWTLRGIEQITELEEQERNE